MDGSLWGPRGGSFHGTAGNWQDDRLSVRAVSAQGVVAGWSGTGSGVRVNGATSDLAWLPGAASAPRSYAVNDQAQTVGLSGADDAAGYPLGFYSSVGTGGRTIQSFHDLLPAKYRGQLRSAIPYLITNADATTGKPTIVFGAESLEGDSSGDWQARDFQLTWPDANTTAVEEMRVPSGSEEEPAEELLLRQINVKGSAVGTKTTLSDVFPVKVIEMEYQANDINLGFDLPIDDDRQDLHQPVDQTRPEWWTGVVSRTDGGSTNSNIRYFIVSDARSTS